MFIFNFFSIVKEGNKNVNSWKKNVKKLTALLFIYSQSEIFCYYFVGFLSFSVFETEAKKISQNILPLIHQNRKSFFIQFFCWGGGDWITAKTNFEKQTEKETASEPNSNITKLCMKIEQRKCFVVKHNKKLTATCNSP